MTVIADVQAQLVVGRSHLDLDVAGLRAVLVGVHHDVGHRLRDAQRHRILHRGRYAMAFGQFPNRLAGFGDCLRDGWEQPRGVVQLIRLYPSGSALKDCLWPPHQSRHSMVASWRSDPAARLHGPE